MGLLSSIVYRPLSSVVHDPMTYTPVLSYIAAFWPKIIRSNPADSGTLIGLPRPYLVPAEPVGNAMFQEMYYWDSFFMALGLAGTPHEQVIVDMAENMAALLERFGLIPNASRFYFLSRSQPPFFTQLVRLACAVKQRRGDGDLPAFTARMAALAEQEHRTVWSGTAQPHHRLVYRGLSRYFDINYLDILAGCESGWDHSTRCCNQRGEDRWLDHLPVDLNSILYVYEQDLAVLAGETGRPAAMAGWFEAARRRAETIHDLMWDAEQGFFFDFDYRHERRNPEPSLAGFYPLWAGLATPEQAARAVHAWLPRFEKRGGLVTTLRQRAGRQWAWPNGWAPLQWLVVAGLERYGFRDDARRIMRKWCDNCATVFAATGVLWEKYHVVRVGARAEAGLYGSVPGFGWSNAVFADFARRLAEQQ